MLVQVETCDLVLVRRRVQHFDEVLKLFRSQCALVVFLVVIVAVADVSWALIHDLHVVFFDLARAGHGRDIFELHVGSGVEWRGDVIGRVLASVFLFDHDVLAVDWDVSVEFFFVEGLLCSVTVHACKPGCCDASIMGLVHAL